jgi:hypothetical protein
MCPDRSVTMCRVAQPGYTVTVAMAVTAVEDIRLGPAVMVPMQTATATPVPVAKVGTPGMNTMARNARREMAPKEETAVTPLAADELVTAVMAVEVVPPAGGKPATAGRVATEETVTTLERRVLVEQLVSPAASLTRGSRGQTAKTATRSFETATTT